MTMLAPRFSEVEFRVNEWAHWVKGRKGIGPAPIRCRSVECHAEALCGDTWDGLDSDEPEANDDRAFEVELALRKIPTACRAVIEAAYLRYRAHESGILETALESLSRVLAIRC